MNVKDARKIHLVGIGGINMSAVAKLLWEDDRRQTVDRSLIGKSSRLSSIVYRLTGSDIAANEQTEILAKMGIPVAVGHKAENVPSDCDLLVYSSAVPATNPEREEARRRGIREMTNFEFLGEWFDDKKVIVVAGTHGKSTTTAMLGLILEKAGMDPTVIVGSKVPGFELGNVRIGKSDLVVIEGDEYAKHFLAFKPYGLVINNIELDHTDIFPTIEDMKSAFRELLLNVKEGGIIVANGGDPRVVGLIRDALSRETNQPFRTAIMFNDPNGWHVGIEYKPFQNMVTLHRDGGYNEYSFPLRVPGFHNALNASGAFIMALELEAEQWGGVAQMEAVLASFTGIWRRFELLGEKNGAKIYSDYGHHPTAVAATLQAARDARRTAPEAHPPWAETHDARVLLCFQPHHRNRTKHLFLDFVPSFDLADALVLCEIYDVAGRDEKEDADVSSKDIVDAVIRHDADRGVSRPVEYAPNPEVAVQRIMELAKPDDIVIVMGAGDIDEAIRKIMTKSQ